MSTPISTEPEPTKPKLYEHRWFWPGVGVVLVLAIMFSTYLIIVHASNPFETIVPTMFLLLAALAVAAYFGVRRGHTEHFVVIALLLPFIFGAALYQGTVDRVTAELKDFGDDISTEVDGIEGDGDAPLDGDSAAPFGDETPSEDVGEATEKLPLMEGSYTWATTGVTMTWTMKSQGKYGETYDICDDGSCGIIKPEDEKWLMHFEVSVPEGAQAVDGYACPGDMHVVDGNDEDSVWVFNEKSLDEIKPGGTKYGENQYVIAAAAKDQTFYIESTCGADPESESSETAYLEGAFK
jgi:hypothetical protein